MSPKQHQRDERMKRERGQTIGQGRGQGQGRGKKPHPQHPQETTTTAQPTPPPEPTGTTQPPVKLEGTRIINIYDYTDKYSQYVAKGAEYYRSFLAPVGVDVQYHRMEPAGAACWDGTITTPDVGIKMCEDLDNIRTAGSTGMNWIQTGPTEWKLNSNCDFNENCYDQVFSCSPNEGCDGENYGGQFTVNHELGHSTGNLPHRELGDLPYSCMSANGGRAPDELLESEKQKIIDLLPRPSTGMGLVAQPPPEPVSCEGLTPFIR